MLTSVIKQKHCFKFQTISLVQRIFWSSTEITKCTFSVNNCIVLIRTWGFDLSVTLPCNDVLIVTWYILFRLLADCIGAHGCTCALFLKNETNKTLGRQLRCPATPSIYLLALPDIVGMLQLWLLTCVQSFHQQVEKCQCCRYLACSSQPLITCYAYREHASCPVEHARGCCYIIFINCYKWRMELFFYVNHNDVNSKEEKLPLRTWTTNNLSR